MAGCIYISVCCYQWAMASLALFDLSSGADNTLYVGFGSLYAMYQMHREAKEPLPIPEVVESLST